MEGRKATLDTLPDEPRAFALIPETEHIRNITPVPKMEGMRPVLDPNL